MLLLMFLTIAYSKGGLCQWTTTNSGTNAQTVTLNGLQTNLKIGGTSAPTNNYMLDVGYYWYSPAVTPARQGIGTFLIQNNRTHWNGELGIYGDTENGGGNNGAIGPNTCSKIVLQNNSTTTVGRGNIEILANDYNAPNTTLTNPSYTYKNGGFITLGGIYNSNGTGSASWNYTMKLDGKNDKVIIGNGITSDPRKWQSNNYKLFVQTGILTERLKVALTSTIDWADYVFADNYKLMSLYDVEQYINTNKHLPDVPSAQQLVEEGGIDMNQMFAKQMQKIEELTLYMIQLQKENDALKNKITNLENEKR